MATPKKRTGKASQATRRANWKGSIPATTTCPNCKAIVLTHTVCPECGYYKDGFASIKNQKEEMKVEEVKTEAPKAKKSTKKAATAVLEKTEEKVEVATEKEVEETKE